MIIQNGQFLHDVRSSANQLHLILNLGLNDKGSVLCINAPGIYNTNKYLVLNYYALTCKQVPSFYKIINVIFLNIPLASIYLEVNLCDKKEYTTIL